MDRINWVTHHGFQAVFQLARAHGSASLDPPRVQDRAREAIEGVLLRAQQAGYAERDQREIGYALAALADELALAQEGALRTYWSTRPLQLTMFSDNLAGERFFEHLEAARRSPARVDVLRTYYCCIAFGFRGRYGVQGGEVALQALLASVRRQLAALLPAPELLAPDASRPPEPTEPSRSSLWLALAAGVLVLSLAIHLGCRLTLRRELAAFARDSSPAEAR